MRGALSVLAIILAASVAGPWLLPWRYDVIDWNAINAGLGASGHLLGTDSVGRDLLARTLAGTRVTLAVAAAAACVSLVIGCLWGMVAGWIGGRTDEAMMRIVDALYALPFMFVVIVLMVFFGRSILLVFLGIGAVEWLTMARIVRGQTLALKARGFIAAADAAGVTAPRIVFRHIMPNLAGVVLAYLMLTIPQVVMVESFLSFLGLGVQEPLTSLGILVKEGADQMEFQPHLLIVPGALLAIILICLTIAGERLREHFAS